MRSGGTKHHSSPFMVVYLQLQNTVLFLNFGLQKAFLGSYIYIAFLKTQVPLLARKTFNLHNKVSLYIMYSYRWWFLLLRWTVFDELVHLFGETNFF